MNSGNPFADTTIYDMEQRGEFQRFYLTSRCVVWDLAEVEAWLEERRRASRAKAVKRPFRTSNSARPAPLNIRLGRGSCPSTWCNFGCATGPHRSGGLGCNL
jgi:hypothetical protein